MLTVESLPKEMVDVLNVFYAHLIAFSEQEKWPLIVIYSLIVLFSGFWLIRAFVNSKKRQWKILFYGIVIGIVLLWSITSLASIFLVNNSSLKIIGNTIRIFLPALFYFHIWLQISYKQIEGKFVLIEMLFPALLSIWYLYAAVTNSSIHWWPLAFFIYSGIVYVRCFLLVFSVYYQMPKHMRRSGNYLLIGISTNLLGAAVSLLESQLSVYFLSLMIVCLSLYFYHEAFYASISSNLVVTSRDYVLSSLNSMVIILSKGNKIIDWNRKTPESLSNIPEPKYRETYENYMGRLLIDGNGKQSEIHPELIVLEENNNEIRYSVKKTSVSNGKQLFGHVVELSELNDYYIKSQELNELSFFDLQTGLKNRNSYLKEIGQVIESGTKDILILVGAINELDAINNYVGRQAGDRLINSAVGIVQRCIPQNSLLYRVAGNEFVVLLHTAGINTADLLISAIKDACDSCTETNYGQPSFSWGYSIYSNDLSYNDAYYLADSMKRKAIQEYSSPYTSGGIIA